MQLEYFFTPVSPWTYLGHERLIRVCQQHQVEIIPLPIELGSKIFPDSGGLPLAKRAPQRQAYRLVELARWADHLGLPMNIQPKFFPAPDGQALRAIVAVKNATNPTLALRFAGELMRGVWSFEENVGELSGIVSAGKRAGIDETQLTKALADHADQVQIEIEANNQLATQRQVFGAPWYQLHLGSAGDASNNKSAGEPFWGQDRLDLLALRLERIRASR